MQVEWVQTTKATVYFQVFFVRGASGAIKFKSCSTEEMPERKEPS